MLRIRRAIRLGKPLNRSSNRSAKRWAKPLSKQTLRQALHLMGPTLAALTFAGVGSSVAHAQGTMDFSGAQTLMSTFKTFAMYAGAVICLGGLIFAGIRMMSGRFQFTAPNRDLQVANRDLGTIQQIGEDGKISVRMDGNKDRIVRFDSNEMRHLDHGYAVTSHSSQGLTSERVLVNMDTGQPLVGRGDRPTCFSSIIKE